MGGGSSKPEPKNGKSRAETITCLTTELTWTGLTSNDTEELNGTTFLRLEESNFTQCQEECQGEPGRTVYPPKLSKGCLCAQYKTSWVP